MIAGNRSQLVCLSILGTFPGPAWSPVQNIGTVLLSIQSLMNEEPYYNEPCAPPLPVLAARYSDRVRHDTVRVAICDAVEACLRDEPALSGVPCECGPEDVRRLVRQVRGHGEAPGRPEQLLTVVVDPGDGAHVPVRAAAGAPEGARPAGQGQDRGGCRC
ncbi:hypothetical protein HPB51_003181 [Rhipicephalus microplus]|uniref:UBC core domain-containing protein n=1 Tax=Rhipicephalus microplus TaxID=6941 RepID=A0A9J6EKN4_RHIMP|nr:hypothetical protein HPB51_003181 [Rhipicephalus microplus]